MKNKRFLFLLLLFFLLNFSFGLASFSYEKVFANTETNQNKYSFSVVCDGKKFKFFDTDFETNKKMSDFQKNTRNENVNEVANKLLKMGFSKEEISNYLFPEIKDIYQKLETAFQVCPKQEEIFVLKNECKLDFDSAKSGRFLNKEKFYDSVFENIKNNNQNFLLKTTTEEFYLPKLNKEEFKEKSCFSTNFQTSSPERKNNISVALESIDGLVLEDGEVFSFNQTTGERTESAGYKPAKIISGGTFSLGVGGGVCQVSTTVYNACLLAGLEILEVHNHSLPVSYIEPSFDAMVNSGSSDLVVRNNSGGKLIFTTSNKNDICKVKIFGKPNEFKITRFSEKTKIIPAEKEEILVDNKKAEEFGVLAGESKQISFKKDGFCSNGYLNFYDKNGTLVKTKKIRSNTYNPTKGVIIKREDF